MADGGARIGNNNIGNSGKIVVLDANGVFVDVRRHEAPIVAHRAADAVLPNGQKAYFHPQAVAFLEALRELCELRGASLVLFTSRLRKNAMPIVERMGFDPRGCLFGEDCGGRVVPDDSVHPMKSAAAVLARLGLPNYRANDLLFVDDHPERVLLGAADSLRASTYDALDRDSVADLLPLLRAIDSRVARK